ncbi:hypothetical protein C4552_03360 [Candidatus Parcubacteria bacterium]|nr:MAG: hypothetical protein C4552_03360 [Candidatus Parcubacteria bacterium]
MDLQEYTEPRRLEYYSFVWSEARLVIAAVALLIGGRPVLSAILPHPAFSALVGAVLTITWILSGVASGYLLYRWVQAGQEVFGGKDIRDTAAFLIAAVSGINLGLVGLIGTNIGMTILSNYPVFVIVALLYIAAALYLFQRWSASGKKLFR